MDSRTYNINIAAGATYCVLNVLWGRKEHYSHVRPNLMLTQCAPIVTAAVRVHAISGRDWRPAVVVMALYLVPVLSTIVRLYACDASFADKCASVHLQPPQMGIHRRPVLHFQHCIE